MIKLGRRHHADALREAEEARPLSCRQVRQAGSANGERPPSMTPSGSDFGICGVDSPFVALPVRVCSLRVHPHSTKSNIPIWKCAWCDDRKGKLTETEIKTLESYVRLFGWPVLPLTFNDDGCVYAYGQLSKMRKAPARVRWKDGGVSTVPATVTQLTTSSAFLEKAEALWPGIEVTLRSEESG